MLTVHLSTAKVKREWLYTSAPPYAFMVWTGYCRVERLTLDRSAYLLRFDVRIVTCRQREVKMST